MQLAQDGTLLLLKSMGQSGSIVKPYDGTGGCTTLKIWKESLLCYFALFNINPGQNQVTVAACFMEGGAKDWWNHLCSTGDHKDIKDIEELVRSLHITFRPLNEDLQLSWRWKTLQ